MTLAGAKTVGGRFVSFAVRPDTNDGALVTGVVTEDEYGLRKLGVLSGWAIDIGAHVGSVAVALAADNPDLQVVAVEAIPDNADLIRRTAQQNGLADRVHVIAAAAASEAEHDTGKRIPITYGWTSSENQPDSYMRESRFIGGMVPANETSRTIACPAISLGAICERFGIVEVSLLKTDCEGCEWFVLTSPAVARVRRITGEMHVSSHGDAAYLHRLLDPTHEVTIAKPDLNVSLFEAVRR